MSIQGRVFIVSTDGSDSSATLQIGAQYNIRVCEVNGVVTYHGPRVVELTANS